MECNKAYEDADLVIEISEEISKYFMNAFDHPRLEELKHDKFKYLAVIHAMESFLFSFLRAATNDKESFDIILKGMIGNVQDAYDTYKKHKLDLSNGLQH